MDKIEHNYQSMKNIPFTVCVVKCVVKREMQLLEQEGAQHPRPYWEFQSLLRQLQISPCGEHCRRQKSAEVPMMLWKAEWCGGAGEWQHTLAVELKLSRGQAARDTSQLCPRQRKLILNF